MHLDLTDIVGRGAGAREVVEHYSGPGVVAGYNVVHGRGQTPKGVALIDTEQGLRAMLTTEDPAIVAAMQEVRELVGSAAVARDDALVGIA